MTSADSIDQASSTVKRSYSKHPPSSTSSKSYAQISEQQNIMTYNRPVYAAEASSFSSTETSYTPEDQYPSPMDSFTSPRSSMELPIYTPFSSHSSWSLPYTRSTPPSPTPPARYDPFPVRNRQVGSAPNLCVPYRSFNPFVHGFQPDTPNEGIEICELARLRIQAALSQSPFSTGSRDAVSEDDRLHCINFPEHCSRQWCQTCDEGVVDRQCDACRFPKRTGWIYLVLVMICLVLFVAGTSLWVYYAVLVHETAGNC